MRLALVTNDYPPRPGGIQQYLGNLVAAWPDPVLVLAPSLRDGESATADGQHVRRGPRRFMWPTPSIRRWVERELSAFRPDAVLFGAPYPLPVLGPRVRATLDVPFGVIGHGAEVTLPAAVPGLRWAFARTLAAADVRFAVSRFTKARLERLTGADVRYLGAGVDTDVFTPVERPAGDHLVVGCVSRFVPRKGQHRLIDAAAGLARSGLPVRVQLVGRGRREQALRRRAARLGVETDFAVDVAWSDLPDLYRTMDVFCMPCRSRWFGLEVEGLGLVYLEAAATGLPVLAGSSGGSPETVEPGRTGYVVHTTDHIGSAIRRLAKDPGLRAEMGRRGRVRVVADYTWSRVVERLREGFSSV